MGEPGSEWASSLTFNEVGFSVASPNEGGIEVVGDSFEAFADLPHIDQVQVVELPVIVPLRKQHFIMTVTWRSDLPETGQSIYGKGPCQSNSLS